MSGSADLGFYPLRCGLGRRKRRNALMLVSASCGFC